MSDSCAKFHEPESIFNPWKRLFYWTCLKCKNTTKMLIFLTKRMKISTLLVKIVQKNLFYYLSSFVINYLKALRCKKNRFTAKICQKLSKKSLFLEKFRKMVSSTQIFGHLGIVKVKIYIFKLITLCNKALKMEKIGFLTEILLWRSIFSSS